MTVSAGKYEEINLECQRAQSRAQSRAERERDQSIAKALRDDVQAELNRQLKMAAFLNCPLAWLAVFNLTRHLVEAEDCVTRKAASFEALRFRWHYPFYKDWSVRDTIRVHFALDPRESVPVMRTASKSPQWRIGYQHSFKPIRRFRFPDPDFHEFNTLMGNAPICMIKEGQFNALETVGNVAHYLLEAFHLWVEYALFSEMNRFCALEMKSQDSWVSIKDKIDGIDRVDAGNILGIYREVEGHETSPIHTLIRLAQEEGSIAIRTAHPYWRASRACPHDCFFLLGKDALRMDIHWPPTVEMCDLEGDKDEFRLAFNLSVHAYVQALNPQNILKVKVTS